jgi:ferric-dicitrate binding protein FerR (iron transport regulator)
MLTQNDEHITHLIFRSIVGSISEQEASELEAWRQESEEHEQESQRLMDSHDLQAGYLRRKMLRTDRLEKEMEDRIAEYRRQRNLRHWWRYAVAASLLLLVGVGIGYVAFHDTIQPAQPTVKTAMNAIVPGEAKATLMLDNGEKVELGTDTKANASALKKLKTEAPKAKVSLEVPRGGEFKVELEDGTVVWLNSESRLDYPESFEGSERRVAVTGEAYFKVAKDAAKPFIVETAGQRVKVYGTEFNVKSYAEDDCVFTTLVEGSISLSKAGEQSGELMLTPGHQALFNKESKSTQVKSVDTEVVTSWRHGSFSFEDQTLEQIMQTLSRWYDFDYVFKDSSVGKTVFMGSVARYAQFADVLSMLEKAGDAKFVQKGRTVYIYRK